MGTQKNRLNERVLLSTQNICFKLMRKKYFNFYTQKLCLSRPTCMPKTVDDKHTCTKLVTGWTLKTHLHVEYFVCFKKVGNKQRSFQHDVGNFFACSVVAYFCILTTNNHDIWLFPVTRSKFFFKFQGENTLVKEHKNNLRHFISSDCMHCATANYYCISNLKMY